jgi:O-antigen/teichoic acid export membrane protein
MLIVIAFAANSLLNFVIGLLVAWLLGPEAFGIYAIGATLLVVLNACFLEWIKLSAVRFYTLDSPDRVPVRRSLDGLFTMSALGMGVIVALAWSLGLDAGLPAGLMMATVAAAIGGGLFDYLQAIARARRSDAVFAKLVLLKNVLALLLMAGGAFLFQSPLLVMLGLAASGSLAVVACWSRLSEGPLVWSPPERHEIRLFASYGFPLVAATVLYASVALLNRVVMMDRFGLAEVGAFALASDIGFKVLCTTSAALEILMLPAVVAIAEKSNPEVVRQALARNMVIGLAVLLPLAAGLITVLPTFEQLLVPPAFRGRFEVYVMWLMPAFLALAMAQACFNPVFMIGKDTRHAIAAAATAVGVNAVALFFLKDSPSPQSIAIAMALGMGTGLLVMAATAIRRLDAPLAWGEIARILLATAVMTGVLWPFRLLGPAWIALPVMAICGMAIYVAIIAACNVAGSRDWLRQRLARRSA